MRFYGSLPRDTSAKPQPFEYTWASRKCMVWLNISFPCLDIKFVYNLCSVLVTPEINVG